MRTLFRPAITLFILMTIITGLIYPLMMTGISQLIFPQQANGSLIYQGDKIVGSKLIGQNFSGVNYFWSRPSAISPIPFDATNSSGSNLGPTNPTLVTAIKARIESTRFANPTQKGSVPADLVTTSASGLDPHISPAAAEYQIARVANARKMPKEKIKSLVEKYTEAPQWYLFGEPRVNVLMLNLALDDETAHG